MLRQAKSIFSFLPSNPINDFLKRSLYLAPPFLVDDYTPVAITSYRLGFAKRKVEAAVNELKECTACPRACKVNRLDDDKSGVCGIGRKALISCAVPHFGEESVLQGSRGSGTIFFGGCNMKCVFCQNWDVSQRVESGYPMTGPEIADWMLRLQDDGQCHNINFVTPEHVAPQVAEAIFSAVERGLNLPIVYNTSSYDSVSSLKILEGLIDIYLPDFKFWNGETAARLAKARDYPENARLAIKEMYRQVGDLRFNPDGVAQNGLLVRHLVMPSLVEEGKAIMKWISDEISKDTYVHLMEQYRPDHLVGKGEVRSRGGFTKYDEINRPASKEEITVLRAYAGEVGLWRFEE
mmetsp:Transcript_19597/g.35341  ORF Transcript_19597/g.35341 Transcript_19597/m.35341 type:complete len:350 (-) Transcript_19597:456-1505(-)|eukprot:CAMPEP_0175045154 /NCGR_PEP_ID=MMETSP0052_2-20121109/4237_1 /TAXON_ID=51329 ORGANISM="Polytomella parva, Strain SAG 63-3" /NCGR_SAMPLE_ID=MMETSP0052_2 /ASSEMBLY_ACC=CAM_ASM_000194 /LENGTH=349 /DNA_ID=CAMNT_0016308597 /DNA_START=84 /DNA_END=1133 /DNA_ORIENTATION=-